MHEATTISSSATRGRAITNETKISRHWWAPDRLLAPSFYAYIVGLHLRPPLVDVTPSGVRGALDLRLRSARFSTPSCTWSVYVWLANTNPVSLSTNICNLSTTLFKDNPFSWKTPLWRSELQTFTQRKGQTIQFASEPTPFRLIPWRTKGTFNIKKLHNLLAIFCFKFNIFLNLNLLRWKGLRFSQSWKTHSSVMKQVLAVRWRFKKNEHWNFLLDFFLLSIPKQTCLYLRI